ncbi:laminin subunit alpha-3 [Salvelinus sp. IW2-2015]|uniref:laminin subunit alpha-3 n=1 Tax=Salvelinus sp. IW2-2015 TaxID=2691554 RepID=UPI000CDF8C4E|nr:laminin subunit alpha-3 [Salvelinus alpinus]
MKMTQGTVCWFGGVWGLLLWCALFGPCTDGQRAPQRHPNCRYDYLPQNHQSGKDPWHKGHPRIPRKYCDTSFNNQSAGAITQRCGPGYYRERTGPHRGQCVPCNCNSLSNECDEQTGRCLNCQYNTDGDRCERCKEGYYGNAAQKTCRGCPCPFRANNFAVACLDIGANEIECLCKPGYTGTRCERCAPDYYGNPMIYGGRCQRCHCDATSTCDHLTGKCKKPDDPGTDDQCIECDSCTQALLNDLENMDDGLELLRQQLQGIGSNSSPANLNQLEGAINETKALVGRYSTTVDAQGPKVNLLEAEVMSLGQDISLLEDKASYSLSDAENVLVKVIQTKQRAEDFIPEAQDLLMNIEDLLQQLSEANSSVTNITVGVEEVARMMKVVQRMVKEMRQLGCSNQTVTAAREQEDAHKLLDFIKNNVAAPLDDNQAVANETAESLMTSVSALSDLAAAVAEANNMVNRTRSLNFNSTDFLRILTQLRGELERKRDSVLPEMNMTKDKLKNITGLVEMMKEMKKEYEHLAAEIDGAKPNLTKRLNDIAKAKQKEGIVVMAEEHAEELNRLAMELHMAVHNATNSSDLQHASESIRAYSSIIKAIEEAEMEANQSKEASDKALKDVEEQGLTNRSEELKHNASSLLTEAMNAEKDLRETSAKVDNHKQRVGQTKNKREMLRKDALAVTENLKEIQRDDIGKLIDSAKATVNAANNTVNDVTDRLNNISLGHIRLPNVSSNIGSVLDEAGNELKKLNETWPTLEDTLSRVQNLCSQAPPSVSMTDSIRRIKDVIEEARDIVKRLSIGMTFNGKGHIELRPPTNVEDLKAFTAAELLLNRQETKPTRGDRSRRRRQNTQDDRNLFVLYLGNKDSSKDFIGMAVKNNTLRCVYKLGGVVHELNTDHITRTKVNSTVFDKVVFNRVYQDAELSLTHRFPSQSVEVSKESNRPNTTVGLLNLDTNSVVFYVGGYPDAFTPPVELRYPKYCGAIKLSTINDQFFSLYNFKNAINVDKQSYIKVSVSLQSTVPYYFDGTGYGLVTAIKEIETPKRGVLKFHTNSQVENALLFYKGNEDSYTSVTVERGYVVLQGRHGTQVLNAKSTRKVSLNNEQFVIVMDTTFKVHVAGVPTEIVKIDNIMEGFKHFYIGGLPASLRERDNVTTPPFRGCIDNVILQSKEIEFNTTIGVSVGCPTSLLGVREATFHPGGSLSVDPQDFWTTPAAMVSLGFRTMENKGVLLRTSEERHGYQLSLVDGYVMFNFDENALKSTKTYNDGRWHYLTALRNGTQLELRVDNGDLGQHQTSPQDKPNEQQVVLGGETFRGCLANLHIRRPEESFIPADFSSFTQKGDVILGMCRLQPPPQAIWEPASLQERPKKLKPRSGAVHTECRLPKVSDPQAYQLTGAASWLSYIIAPEELNFRPHFSLEIRTRSSEGLLLHVSGNGDISQVSLYMTNGKIKLSLGKDRVIYNKKKSNDGRWHTVMVSVEKNTFHLVVDGFRVPDGILPAEEGSSLALQNPVYLGSDPASKTSWGQGGSLPKKSVIGCIRHFKVYNVLVGEPAANHGAPPCFDGATETGAYFAGTGHVVLDKFFTVGSRFELTFEARPRNTTGLLFHARGRRRNSLSVFMRKNKVEVHVNDGLGDYSASVTPQQNLCDGTFHVIAVSKQNNVVQLNVDSESQRTVGPSHSSYTMTKDSFYIGGMSGTSKHKGVPVSSSFVGCLRNIKVNKKPVVFKTASSVVGPVNVNECPAD